MAPSTSTHHARPLSELGPGRLAAAAYSDRVRRVPPGAVGRWWRGGLIGMERTFGPALLLGLVFSMLTAAVTVLPMLAGAPVWMTPAAALVLVVTPHLACGFFEIARTAEAGGTPSFGRALLAWRGRGLRLAGVGITLAVLMFAWERAATLVYALSIPYHAADFADLATVAIDGEAQVFLIAAVVLAAALATLAFMGGMIGMPLTWEHDTDIFTAVFVSGISVFGNPKALLGFGVTAAAVWLIGLAAGTLGLAVVMPVIALASWTGYREVVRWR